MPVFLVLNAGWSWLLRLGSVGLILVGIIDQSFVPIPGGIDFVTIILTAAHRSFWPLYWLMATAGATLGAWLTYRVSKKGGKEALENRLPHDKIKKVEKAFEKGGFVALFIATLVPPPIPMVPVVVGAGALQYPSRKFLIAIASGRVIRYGVVAWLAHIYGEHIMRAIKAHQVAIVGGFLVFSVGAAVIGWLWTRHQLAKQRAARGRAPEEQAA